VGATSGPTTHNATGVLQEAVLSPILFNIFMAELAFRLGEVQGLGFTIYADDITFRTAGASLAAQQNTLQHALDVTSEFLEDNGMALSPTKTKYMIVAHRKRR
ncbi:hypothetical protein HPB47_002647, partial [Ixodes persulcatus]